MVVENHRDFMPDDTMYMSGPPLHVLSMTLLGELDAALPGVLAVGENDGDVQVSFSAGITKENLGAAVGLGLAPVTICSDLLKPGGYGRLKPMLTTLGHAMEEAGAADLAGWRTVRTAEAHATGHSGVVSHYIATLHDPETNGAYTRDGTSKLPRDVDHELEMWGCVACNFCVTVCPNDAFFRLPTPEDMEVEGRQQYFVLAELCNECGNCLTFCPEIGDPAVVKPRIYTELSRFESGDRPGFLVAAGPDRIDVRAAAGLDAEVERLTWILNEPEGLPLQLSTLLEAGS